MKKTLLCLFLASFLWACTDNDDPIILGQRFSKIYNRGNFEEFNAIDIKQTPDNGLLVLGNYYAPVTQDDNLNAVSSTAFLMKTDQNGKIVWDKVLEKGAVRFINPVSELIVIDANTYLVWCTDAQSQKPTLVKVVAQGNDVSFDAVLVPAQSDFNRPSAIIQVADKQEYIMTDMSLKDTLTNVYFVNSSFAITSTLKEKNSQLFDIKNIATRSFICANNQTYYISQAVIGGGNIFTVNAPAITLNRISQSPMALATSDNNLLNGAFTDSRDVGFMLNKNISEIGDNLKLTIFHEILPQEKFVIKPITVNDEKIFVYGGSIENGQMAIYFFDDKAVYKNKILLGNTNAYKLANFVITYDKGLAVVGSTIVGDRFERICIFKISESEIKEKLK